MITAQNTQSCSDAEAWRFGLTSGLVAGGLDGVLIAATSDAAPWLIVQSVAAWTITGWAVFATSSMLRPVAHGIAVSLLLNLAWYIQLAVIPAQYALLPPLIVMSVLFGVGLGWAKARVLRARA